MSEHLEQVAQCVADVNAIALGLAASLDCMEEDLCKDARYYALRACVDAIVEKTEEAADALDMFAMSRQEADKA